MDFDSHSEPSPSPTRDGLGFFDRLGTQFFRKTLVFQHTGAPRNEDVPESIPGSKWQVADPDNVETFFQADHKRSELFLQSLRSGCLGVFLVQNSEMVAYGWTTQPGKGRPPHLPRWAGRTQSFWIFNCHIKSSFRGQGVYKHLLGHLLKQARERGPEPVHVDAFPENVASRRAILSAGFVSCGVTRTLKLWVPGITHLPLAGTWSPEERHPERN